MARPADPFAYVKQMFGEPRAISPESKAGLLNLRWTAENKLLRDQTLGRHPDRYPAEPLPIDDEVRSLLAEDLIVENLRATAYLQARRAVAQACAMADIYVTYRLITLPEMRAFAEYLVSEADSLARQIKSFGNSNFEALVQLAMARTFPGQGRTQRVRETAQRIQSLSAELHTVVGQATSALLDIGESQPPGSAGNVWQIGFIWQAGLSWSALVKRGRISAKSSRFVSFLHQGLASVDEEASDIDWLGTVRTTIRRFGLKDGTWAKRLGEDLAPHYDVG